MIRTASSLPKKYGLPEHLDNREPNRRSDVARLGPGNPGIFIGHATPDKYGEKTPKEFVRLLMNRGLAKNKSLNLYFLGCQFDRDTGLGFSEEVARLLKENGYSNVALHLFDPARFEYETVEGVMDSHWYETTLVHEVKSNTWTYYGIPHFEKHEVITLLNKMDLIEKQKKALNSEKIKLIEENSASPDFDEKMREIVRRFAELEERGDLLQENLNRLKINYQLARTTDPMKLIDQYGKKIKITPSHHRDRSMSSSLLFKDSKKIPSHESLELSENIIAAYKTDKIKVSPKTQEKKAEIKKTK